MKNYIKRIRLKIGKEKIIHPAARIIIENEKGEILVIERADNGRAGIPAGAFEENETIQECIIREVNEMVLKNRTEKFDNFKSDERTKIKQAEVPQV